MVVEDVEALPLNANSRSRIGFPIAHARWASTATCALSVCEVICRERPCPSLMFPDRLRARVNLGFHGALNSGLVSLRGWIGALMRSD
jgi:hypothetical protein